MDKKAQLHYIEEYSVSTHIAPKYCTDNTVEKL